MHEGITLIIAVYTGTAEGERGASTWLQSWLAACHCEVLLTVKGEIPPVQTGVPIQATSCVEMRASPRRPAPPSFSLFVSDIVQIDKRSFFFFLLWQVQLFEKMVEREDSVALYSPYMEVKSVSQSARARYTRLTNGIFLNKVMRVM